MWVGGLGLGLRIDGVWVRVRVQVREFLVGGLGSGSASGCFYGF